MKYRIYKNEREYYPEYFDICDQETLDENMEQSTTALKEYNVEIIRKTSMEAVKSFTPRSLDFVYIDGNHSYPFINKDQLLIG